MHYFCCRDGEAANAATDSVLTWPEGNAWLARRLAEKAGNRIQTGAAVFHVEEKNDGVALDVFHAGENRSERIMADQVIWAAPLFQLPRVQRDISSQLKDAIQQMSHAPWLTANLSLGAPPANARVGASLRGTTCCTAHHRWATWWRIISTCA